jgi:hypothetical protein
MDASICDVLVFYPNQLMPPADFIASHRYNVGRGKVVKLLYCSLSDFLKRGTGYNCCVPRKMRFPYPSAIYHVTSRGNCRKDIFIDDVDRQDFLNTLTEVCQK